MISPSKFIQFNLLIVSVLFLESGFAQDYTLLGLPEGVKTRLGKGWVSGNIAYTPDGTQLAVASSIGIWFYDATTGAEVNLLTGHKSFVTFVAFSPDGTKLASGSWDTTIRLWDVRTGKGIHTLAGHTDSVKSIVFSPDGLMLASRGRDKMIRLWDVDTGESLRTLEGLQFGSRNNKVHLWDASTGETSFTLTVGLHRHWLSPIVFLQSGPIFARGSFDDTIRTWGDVVGAVPSLEGRRDRVKAVAFSPDGSTIAVAQSQGGEGVIRFWDARTGEILRTVQDHWNWRDFYVAFSPDGDSFASAGGWDSMVRLWDARTGEHLGSPETSTSSLRCIAFSPDGSTMAWNRGGLVQFWNRRTGVYNRPYVGHHEQVYSVVFSPDGDTLASGSLDGTIRLWDVRTRELKQTLFGHRSGVTSVVFSPDGFMLASGSQDKTIRLWDARTGEHRQALSGQLAEITSLAFSHDGRFLASGSGGPQPWIESNDNTIRIWNARTGDQLHTLEGHTDGVSCIAFFPEVPILASGSYDDTIRIWNARTGESMRVLEGHTYDVSSLAFSPDGNTLVSGSWDGTILLWEFVYLTTWGGVKNMAIDSTMQTAKLSPSATASTPMETDLLPNYPNPFNPETWIPYRLETPAEVALTIYDTNGQKVRTLDIGHQPSGVYESRERAAHWDGRNEMGETVANGVYFYTLRAGNFSATRKMVVGK